MLYFEANRWNYILKTHENDLTIQLYFLFWLFCERFDHNTVDSLLYREPISAIQLFYIKIEWISNCKCQIFIIISYIYMLSKNNNEILKSVRSASDDLTQI